MSMTSCYFTSNVLNIANVLGDTDLLLPKVDDLWFNDIVGRRSFYVATMKQKENKLVQDEYDGQGI